MGGWNTTASANIYFGDPFIRLGQPELARLKEP